MKKHLDCSWTESLQRLRGDGYCTNLWTKGSPAKPGVAGWVVTTHAVKITISLFAEEIAFVTWMGSGTQWLKHKLQMLTAPGFPSCSVPVSARQKALPALLASSWAQTEPLKGKLFAASLTGTERVWRLGVRLPWNRPFFIETAKYTYFPNIIFLCNCCSCHGRHITVCGKGCEPHNCN